MNEKEMAYKQVVRLPDVTESGNAGSSVIEQVQVARKKRGGKQVDKKHQGCKVSIFRLGWRIAARFSVCDCRIPVKSVKDTGFLTRAGGVLLLGVS